MNNKFLYFINSIWLIITAISFLCYPLSPITNQIPLVDSGIFITCGKWISEGLVMYKDIFDHKGIFVYIYNIIGLGINGLNGVLLLNMLWCIISTNIIYNINKLFINNKFILFFSSSIFLLFLIRTGADNTVELISMPFVCYAYYILLKFIYKEHNINVISIIFISISFGITFLLKPNLSAGIVFLGLLIIYKSIQNKEYKLIAKFSIGFILGCLIVIIPMITYFIKTESLEDFISVFWKFNMEYSSNIKASDKILNFLPVFVIYIPSFFSWILIIIYLIISFKENNSNIKRRNIELFIFLLFTGYLTCGISGYRFGHYLLPVFPIYSLFIALSISTIRRYRLLNVGLYTITGLFILYFVKSLIFTYKDSTNIKNLYIKDISEYINNNTSNEDKISLYKLDASIFYFSNRKSASKYIYLIPIIWARPSILNEYFDDLRKNKPTLLLLPNKCLNEIPDDIIKNYYSENIIDNISILRIRT